MYFVIKKGEKALVNEEVNAECQTDASRVNDNAIKEIDEILRKVCVIDENGKGQCEGCPYREYFFGDAVDEEIVV